MTKFTQRLILILTDALAAPFAAAYPPLIEAAAVALSSIIRTAWPRIMKYQGEILKGLTLCWLELKEQNNFTEELVTAKVAVENAARLFRAVINSNEADKQYGDKSLRMLIDADSQLNGLFAVGESR